MFEEDRAIDRALKQWAQEEKAALVQKKLDESKTNRRFQEWDRLHTNSTYRKGGRNRP